MQPPEQELIQSLTLTPGILSEDLYETNNEPAPTPPYDRTPSVRSPRVDGHARIGSVLALAPPLPASSSFTSRETSNWWNREEMISDNLPPLLCSPLLTINLTILNVMWRYELDDFWVFSTRVCARVYLKPRTLQQKIRARTHTYTRHTEKATSTNIHA